MKIINVFSKNDLIGLKIFNPGNLSVKKVFLHGNRAVVIDPNAQHYGNNSSKIIINGKTYKFCGDCSRFFLLSNFYHNKHASSGHSPYCRECSKIRSVLFYYQNRDYYLLKSREYYTKKLEKNGFPKDMRLTGNRIPTSPKHWHPWSKYYQVVPGGN